MTKQKSTKKALISSILSLALCMAMLIGTTFAWFTDEVTSAGNIIKSGTLDVTMDWMDGKNDPSATDAVWTDASTGAIFDYDKWEPGYTQVRHIKIANVGTLALKYKLNIIANGTVSELADVIDVYYMDPAVAVTNRTNLADSNKIGTLSAVLTNLASDNSTATGNLPAGESVIVTLALKMQETAGNTYQNKVIGADFSVQLVATQLTAEEDSFDNQYDKDASLDFVSVSNANELKIALANKAENIVLTENIETDKTFNVDYATNINGAGHTISRAGGYTGTVFTVNANASLTVEDAIVDGGAVWVSTLADENVSNGGIIATGHLISAESNAKIILNEGAVLQNNDGAHAVNLGTRIGATLIMNGGWIINNRSDSGAIWGGGHITINEGSKINNNSSTGSAGAIRMVSNCNLTMNGGEISNNTAASSGGAIWGYGSSTYNFNGGKMENNFAAVGGAMYTGDGSVVNISGDFELCNNTANEAGALRLSNRTAFNMSGGKISGNLSVNNKTWNGFYGWNPGVNITGGMLEDDICIQGGLTPTVGGDGITGIVNFDVSTNHNTVNLAAEFGSIKFTVAQDDNFGAFNFKPASDYSYTEGDEAKLVCMNEGYSTYWDTTTNTFRLKAD